MTTSRILRTIGALVAASIMAFSLQASAARLINISTRMEVMNGDNVMIAGFIVGGTANKTVVVTAKGPSLVAYGIANALPDPTMTLVRMSDQATIAINDNWGTAANVSDLVTSGFAPSNALESAILINLAPGAYTAIVSPAAGSASGVGLVEVYEVDHPEVPLTNISTRGYVGLDFDVMIGGFVIQGNEPRQVVVTAKGPSLQAYGITNTLNNPALNIVRASDQAVIASNDNWGTAGNLYDLRISCLAPSDSQEAAILLTLQPGAYTAIVAGVGKTTGTGLVEVYDYDGSVNCLANPNTSAIHNGVLGKSYTYFLPRGASGAYGTGYLTSADNPWTPTELTVQWSISTVRGDFSASYPCGGTYGSSGSLNWSVAGSFSECKIDNNGTWYINVRYLNNCSPGSNSPYYPGCPIAYSHSES